MGSRSDVETFLAGGRIAACSIDDEQRSAVLLATLGEYSLLGEATLQATLERLCRDYENGALTLYRLSNGGLYLVPAADSILCLSCPEAGFEGDLFVEAVGVIASLLTFGYLARKTQDPAFVELFHRLREYAREDRELAFVLRITGWGRLS